MNSCYHTIKKRQTQRNGKNKVNKNKQTKNTQFTDHNKANETIISTL